MCFTRQNIQMDYAPDRKAQRRVDMLVAKRRGGQSQVTSHIQPIPQLADASQVSRVVDVLKMADSGARSKGQHAPGSSARVVLTRSARQQKNEKQEIELSPFDLQVGALEPRQWRQLARDARPSGPSRQHDRRRNLRDVGQWRQGE